MSHALFNALQRHFNCADDASLSQHIAFGVRCISKFRGDSAKIGATHILRIYDLTGWSIEYIRHLVADTNESPSSAEMTARRRLAAKKARTVSSKSTPPAPCIHYPEDADLQRLTIIQTPKWVSRVHRVL